MYFVQTIIGGLLFVTVLVSFNLSLEYIKRNPIVALIIALVGRLLYEGFMRFYNFIF